MFSAFFVVLAATNWASAFFDCPVVYPHCVQLQFTTSLRHVVCEQLHSSVITDDIVVY